MTRDPVTGEPATGPVPGTKTVLFDAGPLVGFAAANKLRLLNDLLDRMNVDRSVCWEVDREVTGKDKKYPGVRKRWRAYADSGRIVVLPKVAVTQGDPEVAAQFVALRPVPGAAWSADDIGEYMTIATALVWRRRGYTVLVSIDDGAGADLAREHGLPNLRTEELVTLCVRAGFFNSWNDVTALWRQLGAYSKLPALSGTAIKGEWEKFDANR